MTTDIAKVGPKVGIVVLNWNGWRDTIACIESIRRLDYANYRIYVVDNASADGSEKHLRDWDATLNIIQSGANLGWAGGCNVGLRAALADACDFFFLVNNDATVRPDCLTALVAAAAQPKAAALGSLVLSADDTDHAEFAGCVVDPRTEHPRQIHGPLAAVLRDARIVPVVAVKGCAMLLTRAALEKIGLFEEDFFLNFDETDWCYRATQAGMVNYFVPTSVILHQGAVSFQGTENPLYAYFITRNRLLFARRQLGRTGRYYAWRTVIWEARQALFGQASLPQRVLMLRAHGRAVWDYVRGRFGDCPDSIRESARRYRARD